ncbi:MAG TPA: midcut-by-XrtH protein, partial [Cellvibrionaceae bacterium]
LPVNSPMMLLALALALAALAWWGMRRAGVRSVHSIMVPLLLVSSGVWLASSPELRAQILVQFTNPQGQSLNLPYNPGEGDTFFEVTNSSGVRLRITDIIPPEECLIIDGPENLKPGAAPAEKAMDPGSLKCSACLEYCEVGYVLGNNQSCVIDFTGCAISIIGQ